MNTKKLRGTSKRDLLVRGLAGVVALVLVAAVGTSLVGGDDGADSDHLVTTTLDDAGQLEIGNEVRASGVRVGQVGDVELVDGRAKVTLDVDPSVLPLHEDATLTLRPVNLLGENYVDLDAGSDDAPFMDDAVIPTEQTEVAVTLQDVLDTFQAPTAAALASVVTTLGEGLEGNGSSTAATLERLLPAMQNTERLGRILGGQNEVLSDLVASLDPVAAQLAGEQGAQLDRLVANTTATLEAITAQQAGLEQTIVQLPSTLVEAQRTLARFGGTAEEALPTLRALRPLTGDLSQVVEEIQDFADSADPALASLEPVLDKADELLDQAAPIVAQLRQAGPDIVGTAQQLKPASRELLDQNLDSVMGFVRQWALSTNGRDALSHYFRGVVYVTPSTLDSIAESLIPAGIDLDGNEDNGPEVDLPKVDLPKLPLPSVKLPSLPSLPGLPSGLQLGGRDGVLGGLLGRRGSRTAAPDRTSALGLTRGQERAMLGQLLGGDQ